MPIHSEHSRSNSHSPHDSAGARLSYRVQFVGGNGFRLAGIVDRAAKQADAKQTAPKQGSNVAPVVLFSHCFTCNKDLKAIVRISRQLADQGISVLRYDMTGLGNSDGAFSATNFDTNIADLFAAAEFAAGELGGPIVLMGHSLGGAASLAAAAQWPQHLPALRGVATLAAPSDTRHLAELLVRMDGRVESEGRGQVSIGGRSWETTPQLIANLRTYDLPQKISRLQLPLLLFHSPNDETVALDHAIRIMSWVSDPPASLVVLPGADHLLMSNPADILFVAETLAAWVKRLQAQ